MIPCGKDTLLRFLFSPIPDIVYISKSVSNRRPLFNGKTALKDYQGQAPLSWNDTPTRPRKPSAGLFLFHVKHWNAYAATGFSFFRETAWGTGTSLATHGSRAEDLDPSLIPGPVDVITTRTSAPLGRILDYAEPFLKKKRSVYF
jgi:hypothetical protein